MNYYEFVKGCFLTEADANYNLMRMGLELAEEYLEWQNNPSIAEQGDICFWLILLNPELEPLQTDISSEVLMAEILGKIKRKYRDGASLDGIKELACQLLYAIQQESPICYTMQKIQDANMAKLQKRLIKGTIQGKGDNR